MKKSAIKTSTPGTLLDGQRTSIPQETSMCFGTDGCSRFTGKEADQKEEIFYGSSITQGTPLTPLGSPCAVHEGFVDIPSRCQHYAQFSCQRGISVTTQYGRTNALLVKRDDFIRSAFGDEST